LGLLGFLPDPYGKIAGALSLGSSAAKWMNAMGKDLRAKK